MIATFTHEDRMALLARFPDNYFDLALDDPNYGIGEDGSKNHTRGKCAIAKDYVPYAGNDAEAPPAEYFRELIRVSKNQVIFGANHFISRLPYDSPCWLVWDKDNGASDFADCELAWTSFPGAVRRLKYRWAGMLQEKMGKYDKEIRIHPNHKPVDLYKWILKTVAKPGIKVVDCHLGSASSAIACHDFGVAEFVACDLSLHYLNAGRQRYLNHTLQTKLFNNDHHHTTTPTQGTPPARR